MKHNKWQFQRLNQNISIMLDKQEIEGQLLKMIFCKYKLKALRNNSQKKKKKKVTLN